MGCERCVCGNLLREDTVCEIRRRPCRCDQPGPGSRQGPRLEHLIPDNLNPVQVNQRRKHGLPILVDVEKAHFGRPRWE